VGIDENGIIRKTYPASEGLINFLMAKTLEMNKIKTKLSIIKIF